MIKTELVMVKRNKVFTSSKIIADALEVEHKKVVSTINNLVAKLAKSTVPQSTLLFVKSTEINRLKREYDIYLMNEQAYLLLIMQLGRYKKAFDVQVSITSAFIKMKDQLLLQSNAKWIDERAKGKVIRRSETDVIKEFVSYANSQGSKSAFRYYGNITKMTNKALSLIVENDGSPIKDLATIQSLGFITIIEDLVIGVLEYGMKEGLPYKHIYKLAKEEISKFTAGLVFKPESVSLE